MLNGAGRNLLHRFSRNNLTAIQEAFLKCSFQTSQEKSAKLFPFFKDFKGKSPLDYAYEKKNMQMIYSLFKEMLIYQGSYESQHLITSSFLDKNMKEEGPSLLQKAITEELDIAFVLDSPIFTDRISKETFSMIHGQLDDKIFPDVHKDDSTFTTAYSEKSLIEFYHDRDAYKTMFSAKFPLESH